MTTTPTRPAGATHRRPLSATEVVTRLSKLSGWRLCGDGTDLAIEKSYAFPGYPETLAFANAVAYQAQASDHHPVLTVQHRLCGVRYSTHEPKGLSSADFDSAARVDALFESAYPVAAHG